MYFIRRTLQFNYKGDEDAGKSGLSARVFQLDETTFANASFHPPNACFGNDLPTGLQNATQCKVSRVMSAQCVHLNAKKEFILLDHIQSTG